MLRSLKRTWIVPVVAASLLFGGSPALLADDATEKKDDFKLMLDPLVVQPWFLDVDTNSSKFEEYRDMESGVVIPLLQLYGESADFNRTLGFRLENPSRADARYTLDYGYAGSYGITLDYNRIPHRFGNAGTLLYSDTDPGNLRIPDPVRQSFQDAIEDQIENDPGGFGLDFLRDLLQPFIDTAETVDLQLDRKRARATIDIHKLQPLSWRIDLAQETRKGNRPYGGSFGFSNAVEIPEPIDYRSTSADLGGEWSGQRSGVRFGFRASRFDNRIDSVTYDNPFRVFDTTESRAYLSPGLASIGGPATGRNALAPDNTAADLYLSGRTRLGSRGWFNANVRYGTMNQDERLLPYTSNTAIDTTSDPAAPFVASDPANLPVNRADTEVKLLNLEANAGTKLGDRGSVKFRYRYYDYDNQSSRISFPGYVRFDAVWEEIPRITVPYSFTRQRAGLEFGWDVARATRLGLSIDRESWEREFREIRDSDEDIYEISINHRSGSRFTVRGAFEHGDRTTDEYRTEAQEFSFLDPEGINNQPGLRKFDEAERNYDAASVMATIMASDAVNVTLGLTSRKDDYDRSQFGLVSYDTLNYNVEVGYTPHEKLTFFVFGHRSDAESFQRARQSGGTLSTNPADDWELTLDETTNTFGVGLDARLDRRWSVQLTGQRSDSDGDSIFFSPPGGNPDLAVGFDEYDDNRWLVLRGRLALAVNDRIDAGLTLIREEFTTNRFSRDGLVPYLPGTLILNPNDGDYNADILAVDLTFVF